MTGPILFFSIVLSTLTDASFALLVGLYLAEYWLTPTGFLTESSRRRTHLSLIAVFTLAHLARPWFLAASMSGSTGLAENIAVIPSILSSTHQGKLWYINSAAILLLVATVLRKKLRPLAIASLILIAFLKAATGHSADDGDFTRAELLQFLHIASTAVWSGAILVSGLIVVPRLARTRREAITPYGSKLSQWATWAVILVLVTGLYTSNHELATPLPQVWSTLLMTLWGKILLAKIAFVLLAFILGGASRILCIGKPSSTRLFTRLLFAEAIAMALILILSGWLGNTSPAMSMPM